MFSRCGLPFKRRNALTGRLFDECADADRGGRPPGRRSAVSQGAGGFIDDLKREGMLHAVVLRSPVAHGRIRKSTRQAARAMQGVHAVMTAADIGEAVPIIPLRLANLPEFKGYLQPVIAQRQGPLCRRADRGGGGGDPGAGRGRARGDRTRYRAACRRCRTGMRRQPTNRCCLKLRAVIARCAMRRHLATPMRRSPRPNTRARKHSAAIG